MHSMGKTVTELHAMLKLHEQTLPQKDVAPALHAIRAGRVQKNQKNKSHKAAKGNQGKGKAKMGNAPVPAPSFAPKPKNPPTPKKDNPTKDAICHQCGEVGYWRRNCPVYLAELLKKKNLFQGASTSCIFTIELYSFSSTSWVYDTVCGTHIYITTQGLRISSKLKLGALSLYVGDGHRASVEAIGEFHLCLPSRLVLILHNCHYAPSITRGIISVSHLYKDGFVNRFENNNSISVSRNNLVYFCTILRDDIFEIDLSSSNTNDSSMYAISNKRAKLNLDSTLLWHFRLGHISKKRIEKLQHDGLLNSTDIKSFEKCVSCMSGKMARKPYSHQVERAKDLLGLIHTDEVENQLGKTIKSLRSDRGGEYMSQEFLDHLKEHGIIAHRTPPYTPQHNGVSERRNRTLLDMVRSMMSQTTLPKSFWDYALESAARILNMVPTKKVDKTPYEVWHGQAPKLSYLKVWGCEALVKRDTLTKPDKLEPRSIKCIFVGYPKEMMGYSFYYPPKNKVFVARNAEFLENSLITQEASGSLEDLKIIQEEDTHPSIDTSLHHEEDDQEIDEPQTDIIPIRKSSRTHRAPDRMCLHVDAEEHELGDLGEPANYKAALLDPESDKWLNAMNVEMQSMRDNEVWELVDLPPNGKTVASRQWNKQFDDEIKKFGFSQNRDEPCVYMKASGSYVTFRILYVDDILIMENNISMLQDVKSYLGRCFVMKDLGEAAYILGIKIYRDRSKRLIGLCQSAYIEKILKRYFMKNSKRETIPMHEKLKLSKIQGASTPAKIQRMQNIPYASNPGELHWTTVKNILKYLRNTKDMFLVYRGDTKRELRVSCYNDAGYLTDADDLKSQTGYVFILNGGAVDRKSIKQSIFATSSIDAEHIVAFDASEEAVWIYKFISGLDVVLTIEEPINMYCDNTGAITIAKDHGVTNIFAQKYTIFEKP
ncbi:retrotransposon protein, putative, ty1-copia subclass [Tanacetum coccineum]